ncbi:bifunctional [glutamate--ammonia ligase]-adenylyl-L-tyrosine phosphorylase/[glutamate--ammonia-ligase] adenylyltransferase [Catenovulum sp. SM1970]|uniref:bifunctional [glutamate--ammonia ligase]-adenylyl-L-tyrosine phosphorylase/[glutamate--ammonia-ligase] adenylyltransferase n=1 Tax=Marinifaba aquimaris TaxID=2741323 RepID=UPI001573FBBD|nr:bifunctional [glutamate--ammonia ligase]-adenylyl-L-tyrosine phosphorylase/[glutamate--ammonia-ligase] adenylyltransferase [Marinifaba aquimaris]NTS75920.1 bifunctional [glutamate--ammonia ligase]-adenylyl-L-tyrosine phosphorylase/[glutamate--ammonia-ligase] adenylyltransferase [Marinifaba aquimaris]
MSNQDLGQILPLSQSWQNVPELLTEQAEFNWSKLIQQDERFTTLSAALQDKIKWQFAASDFIARSCLQDTDYLYELVTQDNIASNRIENIEKTLAERIAAINSEDELNRFLRIFRRQQMMLIAWRDLIGEASMDESFRHISALADLSISYALTWLSKHYQAQWGTPLDCDGNEQPLLILGMGKLGGGELNFSSDIDLIFCYPERGETQGGRKSLDNQEYFIRLGRKLINSLNNITADGYVYRVDMRLRPYGDSGPMAMSFAMLEDYYQTQGRDWERYAMLKAKVITAPEHRQHAAVNELYQLFRPFVYRKYIDFSALESFRKMKKLISQEVKRKGLKNNIKLGAGGIREVEFITQTFQLIRGGREQRLRLRSTREAMTQLNILAEFSHDTYQDLRHAYLFLRKVEHILQEINDEQTQTLPDNEINQTRLAFLMGYQDWSSFYQALQDWHHKVHLAFGELISLPEEQAASELKFDYWLDGLTSEAIIEHIEMEHPELDAVFIEQQISQFKFELTKRRVGPRGQEVLTKLMPMLIDALLNQPQAQLLIQRVTELIAKIASRTAYLELLQENAAAREQLLTLLSSSPWIHQQLCTYPMLLDELIDPNQLYRIYPKAQYADELRQRLLRVDEEDLETQMEILRQFKNAQQLRIAAGDITGALPVMKVSDHLTWLAEAILEQVVNIAWHQVTNKHGVPQGLVDSNDKGFAILGYGKLGGWELGYGSDLDMVFVHNQDINGMTVACGQSRVKQREIATQQFYMRFAQRIIHIFETRMHSGTLYEVDTRLRPSGNSGLMVASLNGFAEYQAKEAWTWEHQALVRARAILGDRDLIAELNKVRHNILSTARDREVLQKDVREMREKMRQHLAKGNEEIFDIKQDAGGIADIEFITQFLVLAYSAKHPELTEWSDNVRILETLVARNIIEASTLQKLIDAYLKYRNRGHRLVLAGESVMTQADDFTELRSAISALWHELLVESPQQ